MLMVNMLIIPVNAAMLTRCGLAMVGPARDMAQPYLFHLQGYPYYAVSTYKLGQTIYTYRNKPLPQRPIPYGSQIPLAV